IELDGQQIEDAGEGEVLRLQASEGVPLRLGVYGFDADGDRLHWQVAGLPRGMQFVPAADGSRAELVWVPDQFSAQDSNAGSAGVWRFELRASDGVASFVRNVEIAVANVNQAPRILPLPLQLVQEGMTVGFTVRAIDPDNDALRLSLVRDGSTPEGVHFDAASGYFEWTPGLGTVDNATATQRAFVFTFQASDGIDTVTQQVQVRVFDVNRPPVLQVSNHAVLLGNTLTVPVVLGSGAGGGIVAHDPDGEAQSAALAISFHGLPEGAVFDSASGLLSWTPGPGQIGDSVVGVTVSDGYNTRSATFVLRVVADAQAQAPRIVVSTTP
ncbi:MAG TPA: hypothetical protein DCY18_00805, partial [Thauera sp.]|nr:hypothetical protein [Thauera sp.]